MNTMSHTQTIWIADTLPNAQNNPDEIVWCKSIDDAKYTIQEYEIETINSRFVKGADIFIKPIDKIVIEDSDTYEQINLWLSETNRQYLIDKVELIPKEVSLNNTTSEMTRYILTTHVDGRLKYYSRVNSSSYSAYWSTDMKDVILFNTEAEAETEERQVKIYDKQIASIRKIKINAIINYIY